MANYGIYAHLGQFRQYLAGPSTLGTTKDDTLMACLEQASRLIDSICGRGLYAFVPCYKTMYYDHPGAGVELYLDGDDLLAITTLTNGDGNTISSSDYVLYPPNQTPKYKIALILTSTKAWEISTTQGSRQCISIAGHYGFHTDWDNAWMDANDDVEDDPLTAAATTLTVNDIDGADLFGQSPRIARGMLLKAESEYIYVSDDPTAGSTNTAPIVRGVNGTTAAAHVQNTDLYLYQPPQDIVRACLRLADWLYKQRDAPFEAVAVPGVGMVIPAGIPRDVSAALGPYVKLM